VSSVAVLEWISIVTPLAVRLRDESTLGFYSDGLSASVYPLGNPELVTDGVVNRSGLFVFRNLPGLRDAEHGSGDADFWAANPPQHDFVLAVRDGAGRFLPWSLPVKLPQRHPLGLGIPSIASPAASPVGSPITIQTGDDLAFLPLYSAASRPLPEGLGVLRTELWDAVADEPAAWAMVLATAGDQRTVAGLADAGGRVMLPLPYPKPVVALGPVPGSPLGSPPASGGPITQQSWPVTFTVRYRRRTPAPAIPDLVDVLTQPAATAWQETSRTTPWTSATLRYGQELVLVSRADGGGASSTLLITS
jgi:hypothetical protein